MSAPWDGISWIGVLIRRLNVLYNERYGYINLWLKIIEEM